MQANQTLLQTIQNLIETNSKQVDEIVSLRSEMQQSNAKLAWLTRQMFGRRSEKMGFLNPLD